MKTKSTPAARGTRGATSARSARATPASRPKKSVVPRATKSAVSRAKKGAAATVKKHAAQRATKGTSAATAPDTARWRVRPEIAHREVEGQIVLLLPHADELFTLNDSARVVWRKLVAGATVAELGRELARHYGIAQATAERDVQVLVRELARRRIVASGASRR